MQVPVYCSKCAKVVFVYRTSSGVAHCPECASTLAISASEDVFVSFSFKDVETAHRLVKRLSESGIRCWLAPEQNDPGDDFRESIVRALNEARVFVLLLSPHSATSHYVDLELAWASRRRLPMVPIMVVPCEVPDTILWELGRHNVENPVIPLELRLERLIETVQRSLEVGSRPVPAAPPIVQPQPQPTGVRRDVCPFVGPVPFAPGDGGLLFGREVECAAIIGALLRRRVVLVCAPTGAGKSSLLDTKVRAELDSAHRMEVLKTTRVGLPVPMATPRGEAIRNVFVFSALQDLGDNSRDPSRTLSGFLQARPRGAHTRGRVLILDQFEELFTQHTKWPEHRVAFVDDLIRALDNDPTLHVIFATREEYFLSLNDLLDRLPPVLRPEIIRLRRLESEAVLRAIRMPAAPYAEFAPGVAEEIADELCSMTTQGSNGLVTKKRGEFVELVHLQAVCLELWKRLPEGLSRIEREHLLLAAGQGKTFAEFVDNALVEFYRRVVSEVAEEAAASGHPYPLELIQLGCMKFVSDAGIRLTIHQEKEKGRTGRLPNFIVDKLEAKHLLRAEHRGDDRWYELSHDLMAAPVAQGRDRRVRDLLTATELLDAVLHRASQETDGRLSGYFRAHSDILRECALFRTQRGLFDDEAAFLFRASLVEGHAAVEWMARLAEVDAPMVREVLLQALEHPEANVRANAASVLDLSGDEALKGRLPALALDDPDDAVRTAASQRLASLGDTQLLDRLRSALSTPAAHRAISSLAVVLDARDQGELVPDFDEWYAQVSAQDQRRIRIAAWKRRLHDGIVFTFYVALPASALSALAAGLFKFVPAWFGVSLCQATPSLIGGLFMGMTAGGIWGFTLPSTILIYREIFASRLRSGGMLRPFAPVFWTTLVGVATGLLVMLIVAGVFEMANLAEIGWLSNRECPQFGREFWLDLLVRNRFGLAFALTGAGLGAAMAMTTNSLRASNWLQKIDDVGQLSGLRQFVTLSKRAARVTWTKAWPILASQVVTGVALFWILNAGSQALKPQSLEAGGDALPQTPLARFLAAGEPMREDALADLLGGTNVLAELEKSGMIVRRPDGTVVGSSVERRPHTASRFASKATSEGLALGIAADCGSEAVGGFAALVGMSVGIVALRRGVQLHPRRERS